MNNKELIRYLIKYHNMKRLKRKDKIKPEKLKLYNEIMDGLQSLKKDLEVLEILKKYLKVKSLELGIEDIVICCENEEDLNEIKEWLNK